MTPKIPKGWRKLRVGANIREGDKFWATLFGKWRWREMTAEHVGYLSMCYPVCAGETFIRRIAKKGRK